MAQIAVHAPLAHDSSSTEVTIERSESAHGFFFGTVAFVLVTWAIAIALAVKF